MQSLLFNKCKESLVLFVLLVLLVVNQMNGDINPHGSTTTTNSKINSNIDLLSHTYDLDGCRYVFLDMGSNIGLHVRFLYEPQLYPKQAYSKVVFDKHFPILRNRTDICTVGFEPNSAHKLRLNNLQHYYSQWGIRTHWFNAAISNYNGTVEFAHQGDEAMNEWGFKRGTNRDAAARKVIVPVMNITDFILRNVLHRSIPDKLFHDDPPATVVGKMDVEGEERVILPALFATESICLFSEITVEWHHRDTTLPHFISESVELQHLFSKYENVTKHANSTVGTTHVNNRDIQCRFNLNEFDVETYIDDHESADAALLQHNLAQENPVENKNQRMQAISSRLVEHALQLQ